MFQKAVFVLGRPGAGKSTQCRKIAKEYDFVYLSVGDLLRQEISNPNYRYADLIEKLISEGKLIPDYVICSLLEHAIQKYESDKYLIDGFPRNKNNCDGWNRRISKIIQVVSVLHFECPPEVCMERCLQRGASGSGRIDDSIDILYKRFDTYTLETQPVIEHYKRLNLLSHINSAQSMDEVYENLKMVFDELETIL